MASPNPAPASRCTTRGSSRDRPPRPQPHPHRALRERPLRAPTSPGPLEMPANQASFHLRQLAKYGLVEEAPDAARDRRDRVWRMVNERGVTVDLREMEEAPGARRPSRSSAAPLAWAHGVVEQAFDTIREEGVFRSVSDRAEAHQGRGVRAGPRAGRRDRPLGGPDPWARRGATYLPGVPGHPAVPGRRRGPAPGEERPADRRTRRARKVGAPRWPASARSTAASTCSRVVGKTGTGLSCCPTSSSISVQP